MAVQTLTKEDVLKIHGHLVADFARSEDPIAPPGVRSEALLDSAIGRQYVSLGDTLKYPTISENAATLLYGLCLDHPFHNGNKRTALVATLAHLDRNKASLFKVNQRELFKLMVQVATHTFEVRDDVYKRGRSTTARTPDTEVKGIAGWIWDHVGIIERGEQQITYRELRRLLGRFGFALENPNKNSIDLMRREEEARGLFRKQRVILTKRLSSIPYPGDNPVVPISILKHVRRLCRLTAEDGIDSAAFYDEDTIIDSFINQYRGVLRRLARR